jgi:acylphosphatase
MESVHCIVSGLVQGVGFRYFAYREATGLGLRGYAKNLVSGEVDTYAEGGRTALEHYVSKLRVGPRSAMVSDVKVVWGEASGIGEGFHIG